MPIMPNGTYAESIEEYHLRLLKRAADSLQEYSEEVNGDMNDSLAMEIYEAIAKAEGRA